MSGGFTVCGIPFSRLRSLDEAVDVIASLVRVRPAKAFLISFANPLSVATLHKSATYHQYLSRMNMVMSDAIGMTLTIRLCTDCKNYPRISMDSTSLAPRVFEVACKHNATIALVGGVPGVAETAKTRIQEKFPNLAIIGTQHGFGALEESIAATVALDPAIVICGMGMPHQEAFLVALAEAGWKGCAVTCGGYFDQLSAGFDYYPELLNRLNLRWLYRLIREPRRLWYRYFIEYKPFVWAALREAGRAFAKPHDPRTA